MKEINLTQGQIVLVDDEDYERLTSMGSWHAWWNKDTKTFYASRNARRGDKRIMIYMHRFIILGETRSPLKVDHRDGNTLDNRRCNLRAATSSQNSYNVKKHSDNTSGYKGVAWRKNLQKWVAMIGIDGKSHYLVLFTEKLDAAKAYDKAAVEHFGEFARINFTQGGS